MTEFFQTRMGHTFYEGTVPKIAKALETIAEQLTILTVLQYREIEEAAKPPADRSDRIAGLSILYPDLTVAQLESLDAAARELPVFDIEEPSVRDLTNEEREKGDDDGAEYGDPRDARKERLDD